MTVHTAPEIRVHASVRHTLAVLTMAALAAASFSDGAGANDGDSSTPDQPGLIINRIDSIHSPNWGWQSPGTALSARIHAQSDLLRAHGDAAVDFAAAREIRARAVEQELQNYVDQVRAVWARRKIGEEERRKRRLDVLARQERQNNKTWKRYRDHPELNGRNITNGQALNFLLYRLAANPVAFDETVFDVQDLSFLDLSEEILHDLRVEEALGNGKGFVFRVSEGKPLDVDWWPYLLSMPRYERDRQRFTEAKERVVAEAAAGEYTQGTLDGLEQSLVDLTIKFQEEQTRQIRLESVRTFQEWQATDAFLRNLAWEVARLKAVRDPALFSVGLEFQTDDGTLPLPRLLKTMMRRGLRFAPAQPGEEAAYHHAFDLMRDFFLAANDADE